MSKRTSEWPCTYVLIYWAIVHSPHFKTRLCAVGVPSRAGMPQIGGGGVKKTSSSPTDVRFTDNTALSADDGAAEAAAPLRGTEAAATTALSWLLLLLLLLSSSSGASNETLRGGASKDNEC